MQNIISEANIPTPNFAELEDAPIYAYFVNLGLLGEGIVKGEWLPFPSTPETFKSTLRSIGIDCGKYKRYFVAQYFTDIDGLDEHLPSCPCLNELDALAHIISEMECEDMDIFEAALEFTGVSEMDEIINLTLNLDCFEFIPEVSDDDELGAYCIESFDFCDVPGIDEFLKHVDAMLYGISKRQDENGAYVEGGYIAAIDDITTYYSSKSGFHPECAKCRGI